MWTSKTKKKKKSYGGGERDKIRGIKILKSEEEGHGPHSLLHY
jgi:hypothetical protein